MLNSPPWGLWQPLLPPQRGLRSLLCSRVSEHGAVPGNRPGIGFPPAGLQRSLAQSSQSSGRRGHCSKAPVPLPLPPFHPPPAASLPITRLKAATSELQPRHHLLQEALPEPPPRGEEPLLCAPTLRGLCTTLAYLCVSQLLA